MSKFKKGDEVVFNMRGLAPRTNASKGLVDYYTSYGEVMVQWYELGSRSYQEYNLTLVEPSAEESNATSPNVYKFPKAEVRDISAHLTSYGGQVVQYVARSTRLDGVFKEDKVQDLEKAKLMLQWEIERLEALNA